MSTSSPRATHIDTIRGISIITMIALHVLAYYKHDPFAYALWSLFQVSVPGFIFCSAYLFYHKESHTHVHHGLTYYRKRIVRLLIPYYVFLAGYMLLILIFDPSKITPEYIVRSATFVGGMYVNWLPLLFVGLSLLMPPLLYLKKFQVKLYSALLVCSFITSLFFLPLSWPSWWKIGMLATWPLLLAYSWYLVDTTTQKRSLLSHVIYAGLALAVLGAAQHWLLGRSLDITQNKYPPNALYIAFGILSILALWGLSQSKALRVRTVQKTLKCFSLYSYELFYMHFFILFLLEYMLPSKTMHWLPYAGVVFVLSTALLALLTQAMKLIRHH